MRHGKKFNHLGRKTAHRKAMLANMACSLIEHKRINTTVAKAKALKQFVEPMITKSKTDTTHNTYTTSHIHHTPGSPLQRAAVIARSLGNHPRREGDSQALSARGRRRPWRG